MNESPTTNESRVASSAWLGGVERLRKEWAQRAMYLEAVSGHCQGLLGDCMKGQAAAIRRCIMELAEIAEPVAVEYHGSEMHQKLAAQNEAVNRGANYCEMK